MLVILSPGICPYVKDPDIRVPSSYDMAEGISDKELLSQFKRIAKLPKERKAMVKEFLDAFLLKNDLKEKLTQ